jgi:hypothetical protein
MEQPEARILCAVSSVGATSVTLTPVSGNAGGDMAALDITTIVVNSAATPHASWTGQTLEVRLVAK